MAVKVVEDVGQAIAHINQYSTQHSDAIVTRDEGHARKFLARWTPPQCTGTPPPVFPTERSLALAPKWESAPRNFTAVDRLPWPN